MKIVKTTQENGQDRTGFTTPFDYTADNGTALDRLIAIAAALSVLAVFISIPISEVLL